MMTKAAIFPEQADSSEKQMDCRANSNGNNKLFSTVNCAIKSIGILMVGCAAVFSQMACGGSNEKVAESSTDPEPVERSLPAEQTEPTGEPDSAHPSESTEQPEPTFNQLAARAKELAFQGQFDQAIDLLVQSYDGISAETKLFHTDIQRNCLRLIAYYCQANGEFERSVEFLQKRFDNATKHAEEIAPGASAAIISAAQADLDQAKQLLSLSPQGKDEFARASAIRYSIPVEQGDSKARSEAIRRLDLAMELFRSSVGNDHLATIDCYSIQMDYLYHDQQYADLFDRLDTIEEGFRKVYGGPNERLLTLLGKRAVVIIRLLGDYETAIAENKKAIDMAIQLYGAKHRFCHEYKMKQAGFQMYSEKWSDAVRLLLEILPERSEMNPNGYITASIHHQLGLAYSHLGMHDAAIAHTQTAFDIYRHRAENNPQDRSRIDRLESDCYDLLAKCHQHKGDYATSIEFFKRALEKQKPESLRGIELRGQLAVARANLGNLQQAIAEFESAFDDLKLEISRLRSQQNRTANASMNVLKGTLVTFHASIADIYLADGQFEKAYVNYNQAIQNEIIKGGESRKISLAKWYRGRAHALIGIGSISEAVVNLTEAMDLVFQFRQDLLMGLSGQDAANLAAIVELIHLDLVGLYVQLDYEPAQIFETVAMASNFAFNSYELQAALKSDRAHPELVELRNELSGVQHRLSLIALSNPEKQNPDELLKLRDKKAALDSKLVGKLSALVSDRLDTAKLDDISRSLDRQHALVLYFEANDILTDRRSIHSLLVQNPQSGDSAQLISHQSTQSIKDQISRLYDQIKLDLVAGDAGETAERPANESESASQVLFRYLWEPIENKLGDDVQHIVINPTHLLSNTPWSILQREDHTFVCDRYSTSVVHSIEQFKNILAEPPKSPPQNASFLLCGGLDYGKPNELAREVVHSAINTRSDRVGSWSKIPGAKFEIDSLQPIVEKKLNVKRLGEFAATEEVLSDVLQKVWGAHIATHGFNADAMAQFDSAGNAWINQYPLAMSGIACSSANQSFGSNDLLTDNHLTGSEVLLLNLSELHLVTLSACETGRSLKINGQGSFGIEFALRVAGTKCTLTSLWPVGDVTTPELMKRFYQHWLVEGQTKAEALRLAQVSMKEAGKPVSLFGGWTLNGDFR